VCYLPLLLLLLLLLLFLFLLLLLLREASDLQPVHVGGPTRQRQTFKGPDRRRTKPRPKPLP
jgi:hypothetical protein